MMLYFFFNIRRIGMLEYGKINFWLGNEEKGVYVFG